MPITSMPPCASAEPTAANTAIGARFITNIAIRRTRLASCSVSASRCLPFSPSRLSATPAMSEKTTICNTSLRAMASKIEVGTRLVRNRARLVGGAFRPLAAATAPLFRCRPAPGAMVSTMTSPRTSDTSEAVMNQLITLNATRPMSPASPILPTPLTSVARTSGAIIILTARRKIVVIRPSA